MTKKHILLFDGYCNLCSWSVQFVISQDAHNIFRFIPLQSVEGKELSEKFKIKLPEDDSIILVSNNRVYIKSQAVLEILNVLVGFWSLASILKIIPAKLLDWIYDIVAEYRYKIFGKRKECFIPKS